MTRVVHGILIGAWIIIGFNLLVAFGSIGVFARMAPAITIILEQNVRSLEATEVMLSTLAQHHAGAVNKEKLQTRFETAFDTAAGNVTEPEEPGILSRIENNYLAAFRGDRNARLDAVEAIEQLAAVNRAAMIRADVRAGQLGSAGGWSVALMAGIGFTISLVLLRLLQTRVVDPLQEIHAAVTAYHTGDFKRRCSPSSTTRELRSICLTINAIMDRSDQNDQNDKNDTSDQH
jgi:hypothetical protein